MRYCGNLALGNGTPPQSKPTDIRTAIATKLRTNISSSKAYQPKR